MKKFSLILAVVLVFGLLTGCGGDKGAPKTIEGLFNEVKGISVGNIRAMNASNQSIYYCFDHKAWENTNSEGYYVHGVAPAFTLADATYLDGWSFPTSAGYQTALIAKLLPILESFYEENYKTPANWENATTFANGTQVYGWFSYYIRSNNSAGFGGSAQTSTSPLPRYFYQF